MDPDALVRLYEQAVKDGRPDEAAVLKYDLAAWRRKGGFAPAGGWPVWLDGAA